MGRSGPADHAYKLSQRDREILEVHGRDATITPLTRDYSVTERGMSKLLRRADSRDRDLRQQRLFTAEEA
ncbi:hypothetical protein FKV24_014290 [Lysobacter maris]|uniref:Mor transcription activator domain-containing protein n=1 Tax=Marilutibacter maris TaxID=1605891 RepID=A0A508A7T7_9GAMM|nr:hypothetical protein FKV24_014290 [Lysobacter maris]